MPGTVPYCPALYHRPCTYIPHRTVPARRPVLAVIACSSLLSGPKRSRLADLTCSGCSCSPEGCRRMRLDRVQVILWAGGREQAAGPGRAAAPASQPSQPAQPASPDIQPSCQTASQPASHPARQARQHRPTARIPDSDTFGKKLEKSRIVISPNAGNGSRNGRPFEIYGFPLRTPPAV